MVGDTLDITNLVFAFQNPLFYNLYNTGQLEHTILAIVNNVDGNSVGFGTWTIVENDNPNPWNLIQMGDINFRRGWGFKGYHGFETWGFTMVCLVHEGVDLLQGMGMPNCFYDIPKLDNQTPILYPNFVDNSFQVDFNSSTKSTLQIVDGQGSIVHHLDYESGSNVECSFLSSGIYFVHLMINQQPYYFKVVKN